MGIAGANIRESVSTEVLKLSLEGASVLVSGPLGSGKSHLLRGVARRLERAGALVHSVDCVAGDAPDAVASTAPDAVLVLDNLERADGALLQASFERVRPEQPLLMSLTVGPHHAALMHTLDTIAGSSPRVRTLLETVRRIDLDPVSPAGIERLLHERSEHRLNSATAHLITTLAAGRPGWAVDLLTLAEHGYLSARPRPGIIEAPHSELDLPALRAIARSFGSVSVAAATAALALSELGPIDLPGARDLVGAEATAELTRLGALAKEPGSELFSVPAFIATAIRPHADAELLEQRREAVALRLVAQEALGIPLSEAELLLCARSLRTRTGESEPGLLGRARSRVLQRAAANLISFNGEIEARTFLLRSGALEDEPDPLQHARMLSALVGPAPALEALTVAPRPTSTAALLLHEYLAARFTAELRGNSPSADVIQPGSRAEPGANDRVLDAASTVQSPAQDPPPPPSEDHTLALCADATTVFRLWNDTANFEGETPELYAIAQRSSSPEVAALATALADLELVWHGQLPRGSWLAMGTPIPHPSRDATDLTRTISGPLLLAHALTVLLAGEQALRGEELLAAVNHTSPRDSHTRWLRHFLAAGSALVCGDLERAHLEWELLISTAPRFTPLRLRSYLDHIGAAIRDGRDSAIAPAPPLADKLAESIPERITRYLSGRHHSLDAVASPAGNPLTALPVVRLATAHLQAAHDQNPAELLRAASRLMRLELWAPTAFALRTARMIFLSRRAVGGVQQCDDKLAELEERVSSSVPWYREGSLPAACHTRLTPRERETAALAAEGFSNREIASRLGCGVRTVESHLAQARAKLGSPSRKELAGRLAAVGGGE